MNSNAQVIDNPEQGRFEMAVGDDLAVSYYEVLDGRIVVLRTEVPQQLSGRALAPGWLAASTK
jgi:uncharacterized protein